MSDIVLSSGVRANLLQLQQTSDLITQTQTRLATGKRVNSALDNPTNFFTAQSLNGRANDLNSLLDSIGIAQQTLQATNNGLTSITKLIQSAQATARQAQQTTDTTVRAALASQFDDVLTQIDQLAGDSGFNGKNLLAGDTLTVTFNSDGTLEAGNRRRRRHHRRRPCDRGLGLLGRRHRRRRQHPGRGRRPDRGACHRAHAEQGLRLQPLDRRRCARISPRR